MIYVYIGYYIFVYFYFFEFVIIMKLSIKNGKDTNNVRYKLSR